MNKESLTTIAADLEHCGEAFKGVREDISDTFYAFADRLRNVSDQPIGAPLLRDYFAAHALSGVLAQQDNAGAFEMALYSYRVADAMLEARKR
jgi:hypothetical protein